ncbi:hypothetical protein L3X38_001095 [Prunus dulcis]|uniref:Uncharacterized protein n=1 Tax=Prunus dulcis TaxID=3755 RepID=A0AAD4WRX0_PRUDU|nr:hypothetical protein L3X38_001095 [Prunus dulcis]
MSSASSDQVPQPTSENEHPAAPAAAAEFESPPLTETEAKEQEPLSPPPSLPEVTESEKKKRAGAEADFSIFDFVQGGEQYSGRAGDGLGGEDDGGAE